MGGTFTQPLKEVIDELYNSDYLADYEQSYASLTFNGVTYGKLPVLQDYKKLGLGTYPIFDEDYRKILNGKIIDEYYNQEIGTETIDNFVLILRKKMDQIMPFFNQLYLSEQIEYSALDSMKINSASTNNINQTGTGTGSTTSDNTTTSGSRVIGSDFPQSQLAGDADYATNGSDVNSKSEIAATGSQTNESTNNTDSNGNTLVTGYQGAASDLIVKYRNSLINIDVQVIAELADCFMLVLNNGDEYFTHSYTNGWWF